MSRIDLNSTGVYKIQNIIDGKIYIGSTEDSFRSRWTYHRYTFRHGINSRYLQNSYDKYGKENFIFVPLFECKPEECLEWEQYFFDLYQPWPETGAGYNICKIAGNTSGCRHTKETIDKFSRGFVLISPTGRLIEGKNIKEFCRNNNLPGSNAISHVIDGKLKSYMGWTRCFEDYLILKHFGSFISYQKSNIKFYSVVDPEGKIHKVYNSSKFAQINNLGYPALIRLKNGKINSHKGWTRNLEDYLILKTFGSFSNYEASKNPHILEHESGTRIEVISQTNDCKKLGIGPTSLNDLISGRYKERKGWKYVGRKYSN